MIVDCATYRDGVREDVSGDLSDALDRARVTPEGFVWIGLLEPTADEFDLVSAEFKLHPLAIEDAVHAHQRPKVERYHDMLFVVLKTLHYVEETSDIEVGEIMLFVGDGFVVTVRHGAGSPLGDVRHRIEERPDLLRLGPSSVLYAVFDEVVDSYEVIAHEVEADVIALEHRVFSEARTNDAGAIYKLKREVIEFRSAVQPLTSVVRDLQGDLPAVNKMIRPYLRDVEDHVLRVVGHVESYNELLSSVHQANLAQVSVRMNEDMRKISAWAAIIAVPTAIAGVWGMNFDDMPELHWPFGYPMAIGLMVVVCGGLYRLFRKSGWL